jgi:hypothetical protein
VRPLAAAQTTPSQVAIAPSGDAVVVTERATNSIMTWSLDGSGDRVVRLRVRRGRPLRLAFGHQDGSIWLIDPSGISASVGGAAVDAALSNGSRYLYVRNGALAKVDALRTRRRRLARASLGLFAQRAERTGRG